MTKGKVYLLGAGPGDVNLLTIKGKNALQQADVIVYDRLANPKLLDFAHPDCELIYGGKLPKRPVLRQEELNRLLVEQALAGKTVVRLKGGDPSVFGRVAEEAEALAAHGITFDIVPGITSGIAAPLYAGIPVTHRDYGASFAIMTGHGKAKDGQPLIDWEAAKGMDTIAFYMGIANLPHICENLIKHGKKADTPVILVQWGTYSRQKTLEGTLGTIAQQAADVQFSNPAIVLVGDVINVRKNINWFENKPLFGRQVLLARTSNGESALAKQLADHGADVIEFPKWQRTTLPGNAAILNQLNSYQSVFFASPDCVDDFFRLVMEAGLDIRQLSADIYAGSSKSQKQLNKAGLQANIVNDYRSLEGRLLVVAEKVAGQEVEAGQTDADILLTATKNIDEKHLVVLQQALTEASPDTILFPSSASVAPFIDGLKMADIAAGDLLDQAKIGCLGARTAETLASLNMETDYVPAKATAADLIQEMIK